MSTRTPQKRTGPPPQDKPWYNKATEAVGNLWKDFNSSKKPWYKKSFEFFGKIWAVTNAAIWRAVGATYGVGLLIAVPYTILSTIGLGLVSAVIGAGACIVNGIGKGLWELGKGIKGAFTGKIDEKPVSPIDALKYAGWGFLKAIGGALGLAAIAVAVASGVGSAPIVAGSVVGAVGLTVVGGAYVADTVDNRVSQQISPYVGTPIADPADTSAVSPAIARAAQQVANASAAVYRRKEGSSLEPGVSSYTPDHSAKGREAQAESQSPKGLKTSAKAQTPKVGEAPGGTPSTDRNAPPPNSPAP